MDLFFLSINFDANIKVVQNVYGVFVLLGLQNQLDLAMYALGQLCSSKKNHIILAHVPLASSVGFNFFSTSTCMHHQNLVSEIVEFP